MRVRQWRAPAWAVRGGLLALALVILLASRRLVPDIGYLPRLIAIGLILVGTLWGIEVLLRLIKRRRRRRT